MKTLIKEENDIIVMYLEGRLDTAAAVQTEADMRPLYDCTDRDIMLDCTHLEYISSSGLRLLLNIYRHQRAIGRRSLIAHVKDHVKEVFEVGGFFMLFELED